MKRGGASNDPQRTSLRHCSVLSRIDWFACIRFPATIICCLPSLSLVAIACRPLSPQVQCVVHTSHPSYQFTSEKNVIVTMLEWNWTPPPTPRLPRWFTIISLMCDFWKFLVLVLDLESVAQWEGSVCVWGGEGRGACTRFFARGSMSRTAPLPTNPHIAKVSHHQHEHVWCIMNEHSDRHFFKNTLTIPTSFFII